MSRPKFSGETSLLLLCMQGQRLCEGEARIALDQGDPKLAAWWEGRAADWRRYEADVRRELDGLFEARAMPREDTSG